MLPVAKTLREEYLAMWLVAAFAVGTLLLSLYGIGRDPLYVFDEGPNVISARSLINGTAPWTMDHPPLGRSLIAAGLQFGGDNPFGWRVASAVAGALTLAAVMLLAYVFLGSVEYMVIAGLLTLFDNFLFVMSRTAMLDVFLMMFLFWGYLLFVLGAVADDELLDRPKRALCFLLAGIFLGMAAACKWNALFSIAALGLIGAVLWLRQRNFSLVWLGFSLSAIPAATYAVTFLPLFRSRGVAFSLGNLLSTQRAMFVYMAAIHGNDILNDSWYRWPFQIEPQRGILYLVGNYAVMFCGAVALVVCAARLVRRFAIPEFVVLALFLVNWLDWLAVPRHFIYYYYYYPCALLLGLALVLALGRWERKLIAGVRVSLIPVFAAFVIFIFCYPHMADLGAPWDTLLGYWR